MGYLEPEGSRLGRVPELKWLQSKRSWRRRSRAAIISWPVASASDYYIDKFKLFSDPEILRRIARMFAPIVSETSPASHRGAPNSAASFWRRRSHRWRTFRCSSCARQPKAYGAFANEYVEGPYQEGQRVLLLEDVVSHGREVMAAKARLGRTQSQSRRLRG